MRREEAGELFGSDAVQVVSVEEVSFVKAGVGGEVDNDGAIAVLTKLEGLLENLLQRSLIFTPDGLAISWQDGRLEEDESETVLPAEGRYVEQGRRVCTDIFHTVFVVA